MSNIYNSLRVKACVEKVAKINEVPTGKAKPRVSKPEVSKHKLHAAGGLMGGTIGNRVLLPLSVKPLRKLVSDESTRVWSKPLIEKLLKQEGYKGKMPLNYPITGDPLHSVFVPRGPVLDRITQWTGEVPGISTPSQVDPFIAAHEVGHATGKQGLVRYKMPISMASSLGGLGLLGHAMFTARKGEETPATAYAAPAVAAVGPLATQAEELRATMRALKMLKKAKVPLKHGFQKALAQQGHYLAGGLGMVAPIGLGAYALDRYLSKHRKAPVNK